MVASTGASPTRSAASLLVRVSSRLSRRKAAPRPMSNPMANPSRPSWGGLGELGAVGAWAGVTNSSPLLASAPATWSWASWPLRMASWLDSAASWDVESASRRLISLLIELIWEVSWFSAAVTLLIEEAVLDATKARAEALAMTAARDGLASGGGTAARLGRP